MSWIEVAVALLAASAVAFDSRGPPLDDHFSTCRPDYNGKFEVTIHKLGKRDLGVSKLFLGLYFGCPFELC